MARAVYVTLCVLVSLYCCLPVARATIYDYSKTFSSATTRALTGLSNNYGGTTSTISCSSSSATSYRSNSVAYAYSSNTANTKLVVGAAVSAASDALAAAQTSIQGECRSVEDTSIIFAVAEACARALVKGRTESLSYAFAKGGARASSYGCAYSSAYAYALVEGLAKAVSEAISGDESNKCDIYSDNLGKARVKSIADLTISGMAGSWSSAFAYGTKAGSLAAAGSTAIYYNDVGVYARAVATLFSYACARCTTSGNHCMFCNNWKIPEGDWAKTETFAVAANGRLALSGAISDASSRICSKTVTVSTAIDGLAAAISDICIQLTVSAYGWAKSGGNAYACTGSYAKTDVYALSETYAKVVGEAYALATKKDTCATNAIAGIWAEATARVKADVFLKACISGCAGKGRGSKNTYQDAASRCYDTVKSVYSNSISDSFVAVTTDCNCAGDCWCCNDKPDKRQCTY